MKKFAIHLLIFLMLVIPVFSFAQTPKPGLVQCGRTLEIATVADGKTYQAGEVIPCGFNDFMTLINTIIRFLLFVMAVPIAAIMFAYAGFKMVTSGGNAEARGKAKNIFSNAIFGLVIAAGAWLIIRTILSILGYDGAWIGFTL